MADDSESTYVGFVRWSSCRHLDVKQVGDAVECAWCGQPVVMGAEWWITPPVAPPE